MSSTRGLVTLRKNSGADVGSQERINVNEGANITITLTEDTANKELDLTIASAAGAGAGVLDDAFFPAPDPNDMKGLWLGVLLPDEEDTTIYQTFNIPANYASIDTAVVLLISDATGNLRRSAATDIAACGEDFETHTDSIAAGQVAVTADLISCIDISAALTDATGGDFVAMSFTREGSNVLDTIGDSVYYIGVYLRGSA